MKKIIYLTVFPNPFQYELTNAVKEGLKGKAEFEVIFEKPLPEFRKHWGNFENGNTLSIFFTFKEYLEDKRPDVLIFASYNSKNTAIGIAWARKNKKHFYLGPHEILRGNGIHPVMKYLKLLRYKYIARHAEGIITMGNQSIREISNILPNIKLISIPYSFDLSRIRGFRKETKQNELIFLMSGGLYDFRNPLLGIRVFHQLVKQNSQKKIKLLISGQGPLYDDCLELIKALDLSDKVDWKNDFEDWYDIHNIYKKADVLLALQRWGTWGIIIQEAMAAGMGVISTNTIQSADNLIITGYNGYLTTLKETVILEAMQNYVDDSALADKHGAINRDIVKEIDVSVLHKKFINFISPSIK